MLPHTAVALALFISTTATAAPLLSADQLLDHCQQSQADQQNLCRGYIMGAADAGNACIPESVKFSTLQDLVMATLKRIEPDDATPAQRIRSRLEDVFPCQTEATTTPSKPPHKSPNWSNKERIGK